MLSCDGSAYRIGCLGLSNPAGGSNAGTASRYREDGVKKSRMTDSSDTSASVDGFQSGRPGALVRTAPTPVAKSGLAPFCGVMKIINHLPTRVRRNDARRGLWRYRARSVGHRSNHHLCSCEEQRGRHADSLGCGGSKSRESKLPRP